MILRKATFRDVEPVLNIINQYAEKGMMLARSRNTLYETLRDFIVAEDNGQVIGVGALHLIWDALAEVRSLAVTPEATGKGVGRQIVEALIDEAKQLGIETLFTLTYQREFFARLGFHEVPKEQLSHKVWKDCINCPKFPNCDEIAMIKPLN
ncbi:MAG: N-acetyltransferase [Negativicutes bacterium]|nr:N-acetyltransferase [Negativicutes bacterium]